MLALAATLLFAVFNLLLSVGFTVLHPPPAPRLIHVSHSRELTQTTLVKLGWPCRRRSTMCTSSSPAASPDRAPRRRDAYSRFRGYRPQGQGYMNRAPAPRRQRSAEWQAAGREAGGEDRGERSAVGEPAPTFARFARQATRNGVSGRETWRRPPAGRRALASRPYPLAGFAGAPPQSATQCPRLRFRQSRRRRRRARGRGQSRRQTLTFGRH